MPTDSEKINQAGQVFDALKAENARLAAENAQLKADALDPEARATLDRMLAASGVAVPVAPPASS